MCKVLDGEGKRAFTCSWLTAAWQLLAPCLDAASMVQAPLRLLFCNVPLNHHMGLEPFSPTLKYTTRLKICKTKVRHEQLGKPRGQFGLLFKTGSCDGGVETCISYDHHAELVGFQEGFYRRNKGILTLGQGQHSKKREKPTSIGDFKTTFYSKESGFVKEMPSWKSQN